jgi:isocitrate dehydrogenase kinase/phosphatase
MVPLNIWLEQVNGQALRDAVEEYGNAIRQLAAANIFPAICCLKTSASPATAGWCSTITTKFAI